MRCAVLGLAVVSLAAAGARADALGGRLGPDPPCLLGTTFSEDHGGVSCRPIDCSGGNACPDGLVCADAIALYPPPGSPPPYPEMRPVAGGGRCDCEPARCVPSRWCVPDRAEPYRCVEPRAAASSGGSASCALGRARPVGVAMLALFVALALAIGTRRSR